MIESLKPAIMDHAAKEFPREACGLLLFARGALEYRPCRNIAEKQSDFILDPLDYAAAEDEGDILGVVHSHPNASPRPSQADLVSCEASGMPWWIFSIPGGSWEEIRPRGYKAPLLGRVYSSGVLDCYSLIQDWYRQERGVSLPHIERRENWWKKGDNLYMDHFGAAGFVQVDPKTLDKGDLILMQIQSKVVNHAAIYLGRDVMLHHPMGRLSCREIYGGFWKKVTRLVIRYSGPQ